MQQAALAAELDAAGLLASPANPSPRAMAFPDLPRLPYLDAVNTPYGKSPSQATAMTETPPAKPLTSQQRNRDVAGKASGGQPIWAFPA